MNFPVDTKDELELTIIGTLFIHPERMGEALTTLSPSDFGQLGAKGLFQAMGSLFLANKPIDEVTVLAEAGEDYRAVLDVARLSHYYTTDLGYYIQLLQRENKMSLLHALGTDLAAASSEEAAENIIGRLNGALVQRQSAEITDMPTALARFLESHSGKSKPNHLRWGFQALNESITVGLGSFVVIGGYPSAGKTLLSLQMALSMSETNRVGYFSLETGIDNLMERILAHKTQIPLQKIKKQELSQQNWDSLTAAASELQALNFSLIRAAGMSVANIQAISLQRKFQIVFVDYLQLVQAKGGSRYEQVTAISLALHTMAQSLGITVVALAQLSRPEKVKGKAPPPNMNSFRESGQIEQDADVALLLYPSNPDDNRSQRVLKISKNKDGPKAELFLEFSGPTQTMTEVPRSIQSEYVAAGKYLKQLQRVKTSAGEVELVELSDQIELPF